MSTVIARRIRAVPYRSRLLANADIGGRGSAADAGVSKRGWMRAVGA